MSYISQIMLIEDSPSEILLVREALAEANWEADLEALLSELEAINSIRIHAVNHTSPDLIILDWLLSGNSALQLVRKIRSVDGFQFQPIVILTNTIPPVEAVNSCYSLNVLKFLAKPATFVDTVNLFKDLKGQFQLNGQMTSSGTWVLPSEPILDLVSYGCGDYIKTMD